MVFLTPTFWIRTRRTDRFWRKYEVLKHARHFRGRKNRCYSLAVRAVRRAFVYSTNDRSRRKHDMRELWITRITAGAREHGVKYHCFISGLYKDCTKAEEQNRRQQMAGWKNLFLPKDLFPCQVELNRKVLADMAIYEPKTFKSLAALAKRRGQEGLVAATEEKEQEGIFSRFVQNF